MLGRSRESVLTLIGISAVDEMMSNQGLNLWFFPRASCQGMFMKEMIPSNDLVTIKRSHKAKVAAAFGHHSLDLGWVHLVVIESKVEDAPRSAR